MDKKTIIAGVVAVIAIIWGIVGETSNGSLRSEAAAAQAHQAKLDKELEVISSLAAKDPKCTVCAPILDSIERIRQ